MNGNRMDELIFRSLKGRSTESEEVFLAAWRRASPDNEAQYREMATLIKAARVVLDPGEIPPRPEVTDIIRAPVPLASRQREVDRRSSRLRPRLWLRAGALAASIVFLLVAGSIYREHFTGMASPVEFATGAEEYATVRLRDGSVVQVAPESRLRVLDPGGREVCLEGRAYFAVARLPESTFRVRTESGEVEVLGTQFEVNAELGSLRVAVLEGRVAMRSGPDRVEVEAGEIGHVRGGATAVVRAADTKSLVDWATAVVVFSSASLHEVARELERVYDVHIDLAPGLPPDRTVSGSFVNRRFEEVLVAICEAVNLSCEVEEGGGRIGW